MNKEIYIHLHNNRNGISSEVFEDYDYAMESLENNQNGYIGTITVIIESKAHLFSDFRDGLTEYRKKLNSEYRYEQDLKSLEKTDRL
jgi:hypothetical protein